MVIWNPIKNTFLSIKLLYKVNNYDLSVSSIFSSSCRIYSIRIKTRKAENELSITPSHYPQIIFIELPIYLQGTAR